MVPDGNTLNEANESSTTKDGATTEAVCLPATDSREPVNGVVPTLFKVKPLNFYLPAEWTSGCVAELIEMLEEHMHK